MKDEVPRRMDRSRKRTRRRTRKLSRRFRQRLVPDYRFFPGGYALAPVDITLELTYACNLKCPMCYQKSVQDTPDITTNRTAAPDPEIYKRLIRDVARYQPTFRMTGGEPMLYRHYMDLAETVKQHDLRLILPTNGTLIAPRAEALAALPLDLMIVTLTGPEEIHDAVVGLPGAFRSATAGIRAVLAARNANHASVPRVFINAVWSEENQDCMSDLVRVAGDLGVDAISFTHVWYWDETISETQSRDYPEFGRLVPTCRHAWAGIAPEKVIEQIQRIRRSDPGVPVHFYPDLSDPQIRAYYTDPGTAVTDVLCKVPWLAVYIRPNGDVAPCYLNHSVGNLMESDFFEIWNNAAFRRFRKTLKHSGPFPACRRCTGSFLFRSVSSGRTSL